VGAGGARFRASAAGGFVPGQTSAAAGGMTLRI